VHIDHRRSFHKFYLPVEPLPICGERSLRSKLVAFILALLVIGLFSNLGHTSTSVRVHSFGRVAYPPISDYENITTHEGDLIINGTRTFRIENCTFVQRGNILVQDWSKLVVSNSVLIADNEYYGQIDLFVKGHASFEIINSTITSNFGFCIGNLETARTTVCNSTIQEITCFENSMIEVRNSTISGILVAGASEVTVMDSTLSGMSLGLYNAAGVLHDLKPGQYENYSVNTIGGIVWDLRLINTRINDWGLFLSSEARVVVKNSTLSGIGIHYNSPSLVTNVKPGFYGFWSSEIVTLENCSVSNWGAFFIEPPCTVINSTIGFAVWAQANLSVIQSDISRVDYTDGSGVLCCNETKFNCFRFVDSTPFIYGNIQFSPDCFVGPWVSSNVTRGYKVTVMDTALNPIEDASLFLLKQDNTPIEEVSTYANGEADFNITFTDSNYTDTLRLEATKGNLTGTVYIGFLTGTPVVLKMRYLNDLNVDGTVNIMDIFIVAMAFGSKPGDPNWNQIADINNDSTVNILDIFGVAWDFGKTV
jgi:hypothetical protein